MPPRAFSLLVCLTAGACAPSGPLRESPGHAARMNDAAAAYTACVNREAEKDMKNPAGAEDIAVAAHGRCWSAWQAYRDATHENYLQTARSAQERQFARDKAEAQLRDAEREARRAIMDTVVQRTLPAQKP